jgi:hypothetical protein
MAIRDQFGEYHQTESPIRYPNIPVAFFSLLWYNERTRKGTTAMIHENYYTHLLEALEDEGTVTTEVDGIGLTLIAMPVYDPMDELYTYTGLENTAYESLLRGQEPVLFDVLEGDNYYLGSDGIVLFESEEKLMGNKRRDRWTGKVVGETKTEDSTVRECGGTDNETYNKWAERYDELNGAPESPEDC